MQTRKQIGYITDVSCTFKSYIASMSEYVESKIDIECKISSHQSIFVQFNVSNQYYTLILVTLRS